MKLYAESSAVLSWLLGESAGEACRGALAKASLVMTSGLTLVECDRVILRAVATEGLQEARGADLHAALLRASSAWAVLAIDRDVVERARRAFPGEPIRTLDALHIASALSARASISELSLLSLDERVRRVGRALGFALVP